MQLSINTHKHLTNEVISSLQKNNVYTILDFLRLENRLLERHTSLTYPEIIETKKYLAKTFSARPVNGLTYYQKILSHSALILTGISGLDILLQGGLFTGNIYEFCGTADSDKLRLILKIMANMLCRGNTVYFLDTKGDFSARYMKAELSKSKDQGECLNLLQKILIRHISDKYDLIRALFDVKREFEQGLKARVIIVHSIPGLFFSSNDHTENNNILNSLANILRYLAIENNTVVIVTNLIITWIKGDFKNSQECTERTACGQYWRGVPNVRLKIKKKAQDHLEISLAKYNNVHSQDTKVSISLN